MDMDLVKENIECEQLLGENFCDTVLKTEYVIPDTHPDVSEILVLDAKPIITSKEIMQDKIFIEGQVEYNIIYLAKEEEKSSVFGVNYLGKFSNFIEVTGTEHEMQSETSCFIEHLNCAIVNERKISIEGIVKLKAEVYKNHQFEVINDIKGCEDTQMLRNPASIDRIMETTSGDLIAKCHMVVPSDKPQIGSILKQDIILNKKEVRILEGKIQLDANAHFSILYKAKDSREVFYIEENASVTKEIELADVDPSMESYTDFCVDASQFDMKEDDLGENRIVDIEALIKSSTKIMCKKELDIIEDSYSPTVIMNMTKKDYDLNVMHGHSTVQSIVRGSIEPKQGSPKIMQILMCSGQACVTEKRLVEDKVIVEGLLTATVMYKTYDEDKYIYAADEEIPFSTTVEVPGSKIDMQCVAKLALESLDASIEADTIAIKAVVSSYARVNYITHKEFLVDITPSEEEIPEKKSSITIYTVQQGDSIWKIAKNYFTTTENLVKVNDLEDTDIVKAGQRLIIPGRALI